LLVSIGVLQTPGVSWGIPGTPVVYRVTINRRLSDAYIIDSIDGMGCTGWREWGNRAVDGLSLVAFTCLFLLFRVAGMVCVFSLLKIC